jgi:hypothetical protein
MSHEVKISPAHLLHSGVKGDFIAAVNPSHPFVMDPPSQHGRAVSLVQEHAPVGEYELLLYKKDKPLVQWGKHEWAQWLGLLQTRLTHMHQNPHLHHVQVSMHTGWVGTVGDEYHRVGDVIATSHPIAGGVPLLEWEIINKLRKSERGYVIHDGEDGMMYAPSAPLFAKEVWYMPAEHVRLEQLTTNGREHAAEALALLMGGLCREWSQDNFVLEVHTVLGPQAADATWWIRIYQEERRATGAFTVLPLPEKFVRDLSYLIGPGRA